MRPLGPEAVPLDARALTFADRNGLPLGTILGRDDRHTVAIPLARIAPVFREAVVDAEDRRFWRHGAVDGAAALRALAQALASRRLPRGASTLSMQLARLLYPVAPNVFGKVQEIVVAQRLENGLTKAQILEAYCNRAPMGSNLYGVEAAARTYFGSDAEHLDLAQAALLAALPNDPVRLDPYRHWAALRARARYVLARMAVAGDVSLAQAERAGTEDVALRPRGAGILAGAHFLFFLAPQIAPERSRVQTTLERPLQTFVEAQVRDVVRGLARYDVHDAAAIVIDNRNGDVLAYAGSPDYFNDTELGRNDGVAALRQPGSALKPFLYELALERRAVRPTTILADVPAAYALPGARVYRPADYAQRFSGPVRVRIALADSLNVPAVRVLERVGVPAFLERLHALGFAHLTKPPAFYGLGLTLGAGEVSLFELARAYATLARAGAPTALRTTLDGAAPAQGAASAAPADPSWALVTDMLADAHARAGAFGVDSILALPFPAAAKTGTSSDFRDTWTAGFSRDYTVAVWAGNFDGSPMRGVSGVTGAAPIWSRIMLHLHERAEPGRFDPPRGYMLAPICAQTGTAPAPGCGAVVAEYLDADDRARLARTSARAPGALYDPWLVSQPLRAALGTRILFPRDGDRFAYVAGGASQALKLELAGRPGARVRVTLNGRPLAARGGDYLWPLRLGRYELAVRSSAGRDAVRFDVVPAPSGGRVGFTVSRAEGSAETR